MGMAVFSDVLIRELGLSRTQLSTAYFLGTVGSAMLLPRAGRWYDRYGARFMTVSACLALGGTVFFISFINDLGWMFGELTSLSIAWVTFPLILIGYFGVRFAGQGVLTSASRNVLLVWFEKRRGLVSGIRGVFVSLGFSLAPLLLAFLIDAFGWRGALWVMGAVVGVGFSFFAGLTLRDHPQVSGLPVDGVQNEGKTAPVVSNTVERTGADAKRDPVFWLYSSSLAMHALFGTAVTFHIVAIFGAAGRSPSEAFAYFLPQAIVSVSVNFLASAVADYIRLKPLLVTMLVMFLVGTYGIANLERNFGYWCLVTGFGAGGGLWGVISNLAFIRQFGTLHLGEVSGFNTAITVFASAVGPVAFSVANDLSGSFVTAAYGCGIGLIALLLVAILKQQPYDVKPGMSS